MTRVNPAVKPPAGWDMSGYCTRCDAQRDHVVGAQDGQRWRFHLCLPCRMALEVFLDVANPGPRWKVGQFLHWTPCGIKVTRPRTRIYPGGRRGEWHVECEHCDYRHETRTRGFAHAEATAHRRYHRAGLWPVTSTQGETR